MIQQSTPDNGNAVCLPLPVRSRWQPMRSGLLNLYRYDEQVFEYEHGHLLLRGNNGTGKSRVLALQLPFLLDGEVGAHRLEPDGDPAKRIEWNLLMGRYDTRLGYTWIELGRRDENGQPHFITLGCGLRAVEGRPINRWFFITPKRVGKDLALRSPDGHVFTRDRLAQELGDSGEIYTTVREYRRAVDQALFKLGELRYEALLTLLIQLRQPQLLRDLNERKLSDVLSEALPPVSAEIIDVVAESFRGLEDDRHQLNDLVEAGRGVEQFLKEYRRYAQLAACRRSEEVRSTHAHYESTMRLLRDSERENETAKARLSEIEAQQRQLGIDLEAAEAAVETLRSDPRMRSAETLDRARQDVMAREADVTSAKRDLAQAATRWQQQEEERTTAAVHEAEQTGRVQSIDEAARKAAAMAGLDSAHHGAIDLLGLPEVEDLSNLDIAEELLAEETSRRRQAARHVKALNEQVASAETALREARQRQTDLTEQLDAAVDAHHTAQQGLYDATETFVQAYTVWHSRLTELQPSGPDELADLFRDWVETADGKNPVALAVERAQADAVRRIEEHKGSVQQRRRILKEERDACQAEMDQLEGGNPIPPPLSHTRDQEARPARPGAPLWALCDFSDDVSPEECTGIEAALEASGLLDAWVTPEGALLKAGEQDAVLVTGRSPEAPVDRHLGLVLRPARIQEQDSTCIVSTDIVDAVLRHIGLGDGAGQLWVGIDGHWQAGPMHGFWSKPSPQYIGEEAREANRRERLALLSIRMEEICKALHQLELETTALIVSEETIRQEAQSVPDDAAVRRAVAELGASAAAAEEARKRLADVERQVITRREALNRLVSERERDARDLHIFEWIDNLQGLEDAITDYQLKLQSIWPEIQRLVDAHRQATAASGRAEDAAAERTYRETSLHEVEKKAEAVKAHFRTLEASVGVEAQEIQSRLEEARAGVKQLRDAAARAQEERLLIAGEVARTEERISAQQDTLRLIAAERDTAVASLLQYLETGLLAIAEQELGRADQAAPSVTAAVEFARRIAAAIPVVSTDEDDWERVQNTIHSSFQQLSDVLLAHDYHPTAHTEHGLFLVTVPFHGRDCRMEELRSALIQEIETRERVLSAREREILENHLIGEVAIHLHDRLHAAEKLVLQMNEQLRRRPTSTGMALRFKWDPAEEGPLGFAQARTRLMRVSGTWSPAERTALGEFLHERIRAVRAENDAGTWQEHLTAALDYRRWHTFSVERRQDGQWRRLTKRTHGTGSGGEKAIALIIPQFAAAAAHYESAHEWAPRPILLDEAFVGVDADMRSKCMGLLSVFDLDFVMTSEREWGCYPTLPGVSIYHLSGRPGIDAVGVTRWVWNGRELQRRQVSSVDSTQRIGSPRDTLLEASSGTSAGHRADVDDSDGDTGGVSRGNGDGETE